MLTHGSLFSGIEGFGLAAHWAGWENIFHCEKNKFGQKVIKQHFPNSTLHEDIRTTDFTIYRGRIDVLTGGFPCQPFSLAGQRKGTDDERHLWPQMCRAIREIEPRWIVGENVPGIINWSKGMVFEQVQADMEAEGYEVQAYILPASGRNAPHRRDRIFFIAHCDKRTTRPSSESGTTETNRGSNNGKQEKWGQSSELDYGCSAVLRPITNADSDGHELRKYREDRSAQMQGEGIENKRQWLRDNLNGTCEQEITADPTSNGCANGHTDKQSFECCKKRRVQQFEGGYSLVTDTENIARRMLRNTSETTSTCESNDTSGIIRGICNDASNTCNHGCERMQFGCSPEPGCQQEQPQSQKSATKFYQGNDWQNFPTQSPFCSGDDGLSDRLDRYLRDCGTGLLTEKEIHQIIQQTISTVRKQSLAAYGNAIVPQVVLQIFNSINQYEQICQQ